MNDELQLPSPREKFFPRDRRSIPAARRFAREAFADWRWPQPDDALLCVSELTTNALLHGVPPGRGFRLRLACDGGVLRIEVHDSGDGTPRIPDGHAEPECEREGGHGLLLVSALAGKWGVGVRDPGKVVWCEFDFPRPAPSRL
ncbi:ATP-binding protein [Streptomyces sp. T-3]|nr:ATP-binding protein [Streptomyces sp. T-3]